MNLEGKILGNRYEIIEKIGNGGMATVYKAKCHVLNRYVAVKVLRDEFTTDEEFIKRFEAEAQSAASLTHPNIVSIYDVGNEDNLYYIVMELIKGKTLKQIINDDEKLPWKWSINIAIQVASALEVAHKNNIIHRDIKPHNIIITEDGIAKVTDFGIAKAVSNSTITAFGTTIGSVHYFSPEHAKGGYTDAKSDLYSLGVVMYEMVTGHVPFDADTPVSIALKHMQEEPIEPIEINPDIPLSVNKIIMKAMQKDSNMRYSSASEMLKDLSLSLKRPDGDFVFIRNKDDYATQKVPTYVENRREGTKNKKENKFVKFVKKHKVLSSIIGAIMLFIIAFGGTALIFEMTANKEVALPNFANMTLEEAKKKAEELKLELETKEENSTEVEKGKIISQEPKYMENYKVKEKSLVKLIVSIGTESVEVPKVVGKKESEAVEVLENIGIKVETTEENSEKVKEGYIIKQDIDAYTQIAKGSTVKLTVSKGTGIVEVTVPSLIGKSEDEAKSSITSLKLKSSVSYEEDTTKDNGVVLKQDAESGKKVEEGSTINLTVNKIAETKTATINIDVKSITGGYNKEDTTLTNADKQSVVDIKVNGESKFTQSKVDKNTNSISTQVSGKGTINVVLNIKDDNGGSWTRNCAINLNSESSYSFK